jgi:hypothetical protein
MKTLLNQLPTTISAARAHQKKMQDPTYQAITRIFR